MALSNQQPNGSETLYPHGGRRLTVQGVGLVEIVQHEQLNEEGMTVLSSTIISTEPLSPEQVNRLRNWWEHEWPNRRM